MIYTSRHRSLTTPQKATLFAVCLFSLVLFSALMAALNADPLVLGTEMNTNGLVEYLCLGRGCENIFQ